MTTDLIEKMRRHQEHERIMESARKSMAAARALMDRIDGKAQPEEALSVDGDKPKFHVGDRVFIMGSENQCLGKVVSAEHVLTDFGELVTLEPDDRVEVLPPDKAEEAPEVDTVTFDEVERLEKANRLKGVTNAPDDDTEELTV